MWDLWVEKNIFDRIYWFNWPIPSLLEDNYDIFSLGRNKSVKQIQENFVYSDLAEKIQFNHLPKGVVPFGVWPENNV